MTKLEVTIRQVSDLRDFYLKIKKEKKGVSPAGTTKQRREWLARRAQLSDELNAALPVGGSIVKEMIRDRNCCSKGNSCALPKTRPVFPEMP